MAWIFQNCPDPYGKCIRQYCALGLSFIIFLVCTYSIIMIIRKQHHYQFQIIPLVINTAATLSLLIILTQSQQQNIYLIMLVIQIYSYSLLTYSYVGLYLFGTQKISKQQFKNIKRIFIGFTVLTICGIISLIILQILKQLKCEKTHGIGNLILSLLQIPLYIITFIYVTKTKKYIKQMQQITHNSQQISQSLQQNIAKIKLLGNQDQYIKLKYYQANLVIFFFTLSIILHIITVIMFFSQKTGCSSQNYIYTENIYEIVMFSLFDFATILPHIAIPIILYYVPSFHYATNDVIVFTPKLVGKEKSEYGNVGISTYLFADKLDNIVRKKTNQA